MTVAGDSGDKLDPRHHRLTAGRRTTHKQQQRSIAGIPAAVPSVTEPPKGFQRPVLGVSATGVTAQEDMLGNPASADAAAASADAAATAAAQSAQAAAPHAHAAVAAGRSADGSSCDPASFDSSRMQFSKSPDLQSVTSSRRYAGVVAAAPEVAARASAAAASLSGAENALDAGKIDPVVVARTALQAQLNAEDAWRAVESERQRSKALEAEIAGLTRELKAVRKVFSSGHRPRMM